MNVMICLYMSTDTEEEGSVESLETLGLRWTLEACMASASSVGDGQILYEIIRKHSLFGQGFGRTKTEDRHQKVSHFGDRMLHHVAFQRCRGRK